MAAAESSAMEAAAAKTTSVKAASVKKAAVPMILVMLFPFVMLVPIPIPAPAIGRISAKQPRTAVEGFIAAAAISKRGIAIGGIAAVVPAKASSQRQACRKRDKRYHRGIFHRNDPFQRLIQAHFR